jgi:hypothetical protein
MATYRLEAEAAQDQHNVSAFSMPGASGGQMISGIGALDKWIEWTQSIAASGSYSVVLAYRYYQIAADGMPPTSSPRLIIDGGSPVDVSVGFDNNILTIAFPDVALSAGSHTFMITHGGTPGNAYFTTDYLELNLLTATATSPAVPSGFGATAVSSSGIDLIWTDNANNETGYEIERDTNANFTNPVAVTTTGANANSLANSGLAASTHYYYRLRSVNNAGASGWITADATTQETVPPPPPPPPPPTGGGGGTTMVDFEIDSIQNICNLTVEYGYASTNNVASVSVWQSSLIFTLASGTYYFFVRDTANHATYAVKVKTG